MHHANEYEIVIGLEVHAQLLTNSKLFSGDSIGYGAEPNEQVSPITLGHPGTLPMINKKAIEFAVKMGLACGCDIEADNYFARKNYFYPDLPKGYQVTQHTTPICKKGFVRINVEDEEKLIRLNRIHLEEDAGKSIHDMDPDFTCIDYNRAGTALIEIVTEPDIRTPAEASAFLTEIRKLVRYLDICDGNMEQGSLRCDANISARRKGDESLGTKVEIKNLNSIRHVKKAMEAESLRLIEMLENAAQILQETRRFDINTGLTVPSREKEDADDYRYFPEPDLPPFHIDSLFISEQRKSLPVLAAERINIYINKYGLTAYDAGVITEERAFADYFEALTLHTSRYKAAANWMLGPIKTWLNEKQQEIMAFPVSPVSISALIEMVEAGKISFSSASGKLFPLLLENPGSDATDLAIEYNLLQESTSSSIEPVVDKVLEIFAGKVEEYRKGKKGLLALFVGEVMKRTQGKADPKITNQIILEKLKGNKNQS